MHFDGQKKPKKKSIVCQIKDTSFFFAYHHERGKTKSACHMKRKKLRKMLVT
jgi:hypothetical protein